MAASNVDICNGALLQLGSDIITALNDNTTRAKLCNHFYEKIRDATLREYPWNFATRYIDLGATLAESPTFEFAYAYQIPTVPYVLRVLEPQYRETRIKVVGREVWANEDTLKVKAIVRVTDEAQFDALFYEAFETHLAAVIAWPLTKNSKLRTEAWQIYQARLQAAWEIDSHEGSADEMESDALIDIRRG